MVKSDNLRCVQVRVKIVLSNEEEEISTTISTIRALVKNSRC